MENQIAIFIEITFGLWFFSFVACAVAFRWSWLAAPRRFMPAILLAMVSLIVGYLGMTHFSFAASKTENGHMLWSVNSKWFYITTLIMAGGTLLYTIWKRTKFSASADRTLSA